MMTDRPASLIDPVCGMTVDVPVAETAGLLLEYEGRTWAFCRSGCRRAFLEGPGEYIARAEGSAGHPARGDGQPLIDQGMRLWYESCSCCLSEAFPDIKARLDAERTAQAQAPVAAGTCEVAEGAPTSTSA